MKRNRSVLLLDLGFDAKKNALQNLLISLQIGLLLWASTLIAGFFVPYITRVEADDAGGYYLYSANSNLTEAYLNFDLSFNTMGDQAYLQNFAQLWNGLHSDDSFTFYLCQENVAYVTEFCIDSAFANADGSFTDFLGKPIYDSALSTEVLQNLADGDAYPIFAQLQPDGVARYNYPLKTDAYAMQTFTLDENAMVHFDLAVSSGRLFNAEDFATQSSSVETVNVLLGSAYADYYQIGDKLDLCTELTSTAYRATVIGFLEEGSSVTVQDGKSTYITTTESLDYAIVMPFTLFEGSYWYRISNAYSETYSHGWGIIPTVSEQDVFAWLALQKKIQDYFVAADIPSAQMGNISYSMIYFKSNTTEELLIILCLFATAVAFCGYTIAVFLHAKLLRARKYYAIQILCGRAPVGIIAQFVLMHGAWHLLATACTAWWFHQYVGGYKMPLVCVGLSLVFFALTALPMALAQYRMLGQADFMQHIMEVQDD